MKKYLGIDIGGTTAKYAIVTEDGQIHGRRSFPTGEEAGLEVFLQALKTAAEEVWQDEICGIGICSPGFVDPKTGVIHGGIENLPYLDGVSIPEIMSRWFPGVPITILNDIKAVAMGELWMGAGRDAENFVCLAFGTGLGGAFVLNGRVVYGSHFRAGEVGYLDYQDESNFLEKSVSAINLVSAAAKQLGRPDMDGIVFFDLYRKNDPVCVRLFDEWLQKVSRVIANILIMLDLEKVIIGGGISVQKDILIPALEAAVNSRLPIACRNQCPIVTAQCANNAGMLGAVRQLMLTCADRSAN